GSFEPASAIEDEYIGDVLIDRKAFGRVLRREHLVDQQLEDQLLATLRDAVDGWIRAFVRMEPRVRALTGVDEFLAWLRKQPWQPEILAVPSVQAFLDRARQALKGDDLRKLGTWLEGTGGRQGRRRTTDLDRACALVQVTERQLAAPLKK